MTLKTLIVLALFIALAGCDISRPSSVLCDCQIKPLSDQTDWAPLDQAPSNFDRSEIRALFDVDDPNFKASAFDTSSIHWYRNANGESLGCIVFDASNHVNAVFTLSANDSQASPVDHRLMGIPFGRDPYFWEGCDD